MTRLNFDTAYARLLHAEGGFTKDPNDPGNWTGGACGVGVLKGTKYGIAANTYPDLDIENLTPEQAKEIYYRDWWLKAGGDAFDPAIVFQLWDFAVNSGMENAKRVLQKTAGVAQDGQVGPATVAAVGKFDLNDFLFRFNANKIRYYTSLLKFANYGKSWMNRTADNLDYCAADNIDLKDQSCSQASFFPSSPTSSQPVALPQASSQSSRPAETKASPTLPQPLPLPNLASAKPKSMLSAILSLFPKTAKP